MFPVAQLAEQCDVTFTNRAAHVAQARHTVRFIKQSVAVCSAPTRSPSTTRASLFGTVRRKGVGAEETAFEFPQHKPDDGEGECVTTSLCCH